MSVALTPAGPLTVIALLAWRELCSRLSSVWFWAVASATCLMAWLYGGGFVASFQTESVIVTTDPLLAVNALVVIFLGVVLGLRLAASMAWEREHRTLEVLLISPVGWVTIVGAKFLVELAVLALLVLLYAIYLVVAQPLGAGVIGGHELAGLVLIPVFALPVMGAGLLVGVSLATVRTAVVVFLVLFGGIAALEIAHAVLSAQPVEQQSLASLYIRHALDLSAPVLDLMSPARALATPVWASLHQVPILPGQAILPLVQTALLLVLAVLAGRMRGALR